MWFSGKHFCFGYTQRKKSCFRLEKVEKALIINDKRFWDQKMRKKLKIILVIKK